MRGGVKGGGKVVVKVGKVVGGKLVVEGEKGRGGGKGEEPEEKERFGELRAEAAGETARRLKAWA